MNCYLCNSTTNLSKVNKVTVCRTCKNVNDFEDEEPVTAPLGIVSVGTPISLDEADLENFTVNCSDERMRLLNDLFDECRTIRESMTNYGNQGYFVSASQLTDFFVIMDLIENL